MFPFPGFNVYPVLQLTVNAVPVDPPDDGVTLAAFVTLLLPLQEFAVKYKITINNMTKWPSRKT